MPVEEAVEGGAQRQRAEVDQVRHHARPPSSSMAAGAMGWPSRSTHMPATISSDQSGASVPSGPMRPTSLATLRA